jgi:hypothetical protein
MAWMHVQQGGYPIHGPSGFCGNKGTGTAVHEDAQLTNFWMWLSHGEKHWRMFKCVPEGLGTLDVNEKAEAWLDRRTLCKEACAVRPA